jgi:hypothetical protein
MVTPGMLRRVALVRTDVSEEPGASYIRVTKIGELGTIKAATINRRTLRRNVFATRRNIPDDTVLLLVTVHPPQNSGIVHVTLQDAYKCVK